MKVPVVLKIALLTVAATGFYTYVGQLVPQKEVHPPEVTELAADMTTEDLVGIGEEIVAGKGMCLTCHTIGRSGALRFPDLDGIANRAATRIPGLDALDYLAMSLYAPDDFIVEGFSPGMPTIDKPPIGLSDDEIRAVLSYLQTLGGTATITMDTVIPFAGGDAAPASAATAPIVVASAEPLVEAGCADCHRLDAPGRLEAVSLVDVGARLSRSEILAAIATHDQLGSEPGVAASISLADARALADELASRGGTP